MDFSPEMRHSSSLCSSVLRSFLLFFVLISYAMACSPHKALGEMPLGRIDPEETERTCGRRSLFVLLKLLGCRLSYEDLSKVPVTQQGSSMADLVDAADNLGYRLKTKQGDKSSLRSATYPFIAHIWLDGRKKSMGHYVVLLQQQVDRIYYVDPSGGSNILSCSVKEFEEAWSGYVIVPSNSNDYWLVLFTLLNVIAVIFAPFWIFAFHRLRPRRMAAALVIAMMSAGGCTSSPQTALSEATADATKETDTKNFAKSKPKALKTSIRSRDLGTMPPGTEAKADFTLTNDSTKPVELSLGQPTCGCVGMTLDDPVIAPGRSTRLRMMLSSVSGVESGPREASVEIGLLGSKEQYTFTVKGILEGMKLDPYAIRIPSDLANFTPEPIEGELIIGGSTVKTSTIKQVRFVNERAEDTLAGDFEIGAPLLREEMQLPHYKIRRFTIPISLRRNASPASGSVRLRISYEIGGFSSEYTTMVRMFPKAEAHPQ